MLWTSNEWAGQPACRGPQTLWINQKSSVDDGGQSVELLESRVEERLVVHSHGVWWGE